MEKPASAFRKEDIAHKNADRFICLECRASRPSPGTWRCCMCDPPRYKPHAEFTMCPKSYRGRKRGYCDTCARRNEEEKRAIAQDTWGADNPQTALKHRQRGVGVELCLRAPIVHFSSFVLFLHTSLHMARFRGLERRQPASSAEASATWCRSGVVLARSNCALLIVCAFPTHLCTYGEVPGP